MSESFTLDSFSESITDEAAKGLADEIIPKIYELVPKSTVDRVNKLIDKFVEDPEGTSKAVERMLHAKHTTPNTLTQEPHFAKPENLQRNFNQNGNGVNGSDTTDQQSQNPIQKTDDEKFNTIFDGIVEELEEAQSILGDLTIADLLTMMKEKPEESKQFIRPYFDVIRSY
ncbi:hypothetical protein MmiEs2_04950 [Methanimicrococcus stummii]|uniref:Uncharacterized protein n=1 Tax=Methanimicrococcus stummii TaxID=3028294 RepID=A0AA96ZWU2_9EURY|nr:hypothetical protein [Methanimicrococcus sp. Es2]WNY28310.1 hypothetical protein MmiEs2_04950 [Methanimicrococcus sp. Es2]